jgi:hypothetical protein
MQVSQGGTALRTCTEYDIHGLAQKGLLNQLRLALTQHEVDVATPGPVRAPLQAMRLSRDGLIAPWLRYGWRMVCGTYTWRPVQRSTQLPMVSDVAGTESRTAHRV